MSDFHDDITQTPPPPSGGSPNEVGTSTGADADGSRLARRDGDPGRTGDGAAPVVDRDVVRQRLREERGATQANEGAPAESPPAEAPPAEAPPAEAPPADDPPAENPTDPPANETPTQTDTPKTEREIYDEMIREGLESIAPKNPYGATFEETDPLYLSMQENPDEVMAPLDDDGRPIDTGDDDFGFGGMH